MPKKKTIKNSKAKFKPWGLIVGFVILLVVLIANIFGLTAQKNATDWLIHTQDVKTYLGKLLSDLQDAETGQRGFLLTDELYYLEPFNVGIEGTPKTLQYLSELTSDNPQQQASIEEVKILINQKFAELQQTINLSQMGNKKAAIELVNSDSGKIMMDQIRVKIADMIAEEDRLLQERQARASQVSFFVGLSESFGLILLVLIAVIVYRQISQTLGIAMEAEARAINHANKLEMAAVELEQTNNDLEQFSYIASHDLKSPLKGVNTLASWIQKDLGNTLTGKPAENLDLLRERINRMETLVDDILTYSRASRKDIKLERINLNTVINNLIDLLHIPKGFQIKIANKLPTVMAPKGAFEQIFSNLINNAIKHHDKKTGTITILSGNEGEMWEISVADDGPGIALKYQEKIFKKFQTLESRDDVEGSGLGLSIVKRLVINQGGEINVESIEGKRGTTFLFTWKKIRYKQHKGKRRLLLLK